MFLIHVICNTDTMSVQTHSIKYPFNTVFSTSFLEEVTRTAYTECCVTVTVKVKFKYKLKVNNKSICPIEYFYRVITARDQQPTAYNSKK